jgi:hypothetical protein
MLVDSEEPVKDVERTWNHLQKRDGLRKPRNATDEQVLFMTTCMETWIICDWAALRERYGDKLQTSALLPVPGLVHATRNRTNAYRKG